MESPLSVPVFPLSSFKNHKLLIILAKYCKRVNSKSENLIIPNSSNFSRKLSSVGCYPWKMQMVVGWMLEIIWNTPPEFPLVLWIQTNSTLPSCVRNS